MIRLPLLPAHPLRPLARLQWQLMLSYMTVTVLATILIEVVLLLLLAYYSFFSPTLPQEIATSIAKDTPKVAQYLQKRPVDTVALTQLLKTTVEERDPKQGITLHVALDVNSGYSLICIADAQGQIVTQVPRQTLDARKPLEDQVTAPERELLSRARNKGIDPTLLAQRTPDAHIIAAVPVRNEKGVLLGMVLYRSPIVYDLKKTALFFFSFIVPSALIVALGSGIVGSIFGATTARRLTTRLNGIAQAADAWATGNLTLMAPETGDDELTVLARRLNRMAGELSDLFELRQELAAVDERQRLARELHDTVKQQAFATAMQVGAARALIQRNEMEKALSRLAEAESLANQTQKELKTILEELRPVRGGKRLPEVIKESLEEWERRTGIRGEFLSSEVPSLPESIEMAFLRITQEALANILRHSGATVARVFLHHDKTAGRVTLSISDNGRGFVPDGSVRGMGLSTMRERAEELPNGTFALHTVPGGGVRIEVQCALPELLSHE